MKDKKTNTSLSIRTTEQIANIFREICIITEYNQNIVLKHMIRAYLETLDNKEAQHLLQKLN